MKLYLDENLSPRVAEIARGRCGLDVLTAHDVGGLSWPDDVQLRYAATDGRCLVTRDRDDFIALTITAFESQAPHAGLLIVPRSLPNRRFEAIAAALCDVAERFPKGMEPYSYDYLTAGLLVGTRSVPARHIESTNGPRLQAQPTINRTG